MLGDCFTEKGELGKSIEYYKTASELKGLPDDKLARLHFSLGCAYEANGMDSEARFENGKLTHSKELKRRVDAFREFWDGNYGGVSVQTNVEDQRLGVDVYAISKLEVDVIERKWGQGAKAIGGGGFEKID
jgi:hypothetical protein